MVSDVVAGPLTRVEPPYEPLELEAKTCSNCKQRQPIAMYKPDTRREDGWSLWCSDCRSAQRERLEATRQRGSINGGRLIRPDRPARSSKNAEIAKRIELLSEPEKQRVLFFMVDLLLERDNAREGERELALCTD